MYKKKEILHVSLSGDEKNVEGILDVINLLKKRDDFFSIVSDGENRKKFSLIMRSIHPML